VGCKGFVASGELKSEVDVLEVLIAGGAVVKVFMVVNS
jgi:hypothetical protein